MPSFLRRLNRLFDGKQSPPPQANIEQLLPPPEIDPREERAVFTTLDGIDKEKYIIVHYVFTPRDELSLAQAAARIAIITALRTPYPLPYELIDDRLKYAGLVLSVQNNGQAIIGYPLELCSPNEGLAQLIALCISAGEYDYSSQFWVEQLDFPKGFLERYNGPKFGINGIRTKYSIPDRPLIGATIKSSVKVSLNEIAKQCRACLLGGIDYIADDVLTADPEGELAFEKRVPVLTKVAQEAAKATGESKWYAVNIGASPRRALRYAKMAEAEGVGIIKINGFVMGFPALEEIASETSLPIIATNMGVGLFTRTNPTSVSVTSTGVSEAVISKLSRIAGADGVHLGSINAGCYIQSSWDPAILSLQSNLHHIRSSFAVAGDNITIASIWDNIANFGCDLMLEACGGIFGYPQGPFEGAQVFRKFVEKLPNTLSSQEAQERIFEMARRDSHLRQALVYYNYRPRRKSEGQNV